ncbi:cytochrome P450 6k1-like [Chironomus tepperi]|uniref:cytochrome P450 6k1-like n=1 Tax=Chironomus tepperi TaxID=113505 RepID=UPI00391EF4F4
MITVILAIIILLLCLYFKYQFSFWTRHNIEGPPPVPIFGNLHEFILTKKKHFGEIYNEIYTSYPTARYVGIYKMGMPALLIRDLELIKDILVTNFNTFNSNEFAIDADLDPLIAVNPFCVPGDDWKTQRSQLSPLFTQNRTKVAIPFINGVAKKMMEYIECGPESATMEFDVKELCAKFTTDNVAAVSFGIDGESFTNPNASFRKIGDDIFKPTFINGIKQQIVLFIPIMAKILKVPFVSKESDKQFRQIVQQVIDKRELEKSRNDDLLQVILDLREKHGRDMYSDTVVCGHSMTFLTEGYETSSTTMSMTLYELALNPQIQKRVQLELDQLLTESNGEITEKVILGAEYLEQCIMEVVRLHCPVFNLSKFSVREYEFPPQFEGSTKSLKLPGGTNVVIPVYAIHFDKTYYPNPFKFDPDRFSKENREHIPKYAYLGFGEGPRICLGMKFGITQVKGGVISILSKYNVLKHELTDVPFKFSKSTFNLQPEDKVMLKFEKRKEVIREE